MQKKAAKKAVTPKKKATVKKASTAKKAVAKKTAVKKTAAKKAVAKKVTKTTTKKAVAKKAAVVSEVKTTVKNSAVEDKPKKLTRSEKILEMKAADLMQLGRERGYVTYDELLRSFQKLKKMWISWTIFTNVSTLRVLTCYRAEECWVLIRVKRSSLKEFI